MVVPDAHAVFDSDPNAAESLWPSLAVRDINTTSTNEYRLEYREGSKNIRFHSNAMACLEDIASGISRTVVNIKSNIMPEMMREQDVHCLETAYKHSTPNRPRSQGTYISRHVKTYLLQLIFQRILCNVM